MSASKSPHASLDGKLIVGFQGWFMCPDDGRFNGQWYHWFDKGKPDIDHIHFDVVPDTSELTVEGVCETNIELNNGSQLKLFSDQRPATVLRQFEWMRDYGIDTAALQRFLVDLEPGREVPGKIAIDRVLANVRLAAAKTGVGFYVMYDIVGSDSTAWADTLLNDWVELLRSGITHDPSYQRHNNRPVLCIAGIGSNDRPGSAAQVMDLVRRLRVASESYGGITIIASTATGWRTLDADSKNQNEWRSAYASFDIISPWTVGRYSDSGTYQVFYHARLLPDIAEAKRLEVGYLPVIFPGASTHNISREERNIDRPLNSIPRNHGTFLWMQAVSAKEAGSKMIYLAMFDEVDEGTAVFKLVSNEMGAPRGAQTIELNVDGNTMSPDYYLRLAGKISKMLKSRVVADKALLGR